MGVSQIREFDIHHTRIWALLLLRALSKVGIAPCSNRVLHQVLYFGNTLARIYDFDPPSELVMRHPRGPFYPKAQNDFDWLCLVELASVKDVSYEVINQDTTRRATYDMTKKGFDFLNLCIEDVSWVKESAEFLDDLAMAFSTIDFEYDSEFETKDFTYRKSSSETTPIIHFGTVSDNRSFRASEEIKNLIPDGLKPIPQTSLKLYMSYLNNIAA